MTEESQNKNKAVNLTAFLYNTCIMKRYDSELRSHFKPEFINRLDEIIMFKPLTKDNISKIVDILMKNLNKRVADKELKITLTDNAKQYITENGFDPVYGARPLKRYLQKNVETMSAKMILSGDIDAGDEIIIDYDGNSLVSKIKK